MENKIEINNPTITHLLGYLRPKHWADTIVEYKAEVNQALLKELIRIQEKTYGFELAEDVNEKIKEIKELKEGLK
jgi:hypothetical protein